MRRSTPHRCRWLGVLVGLVAGCGSDGDPTRDAGMIDAGAVDAPLEDATTIDADRDDASAIDAAMLDDAPALDAQPVDARAVDAANQCPTLDLTPAQVCSVALTAGITPCSVGGTGVPSQTATLEVRRPDGARGYLCATVWTAADGYSFGSRLHLRSSATACCGGPTGTNLPWPAVDAAYGSPHGPTRIKPPELLGQISGDLRQNPFTVIVSSSASASDYTAARQQWAAWSGDGQPHAGPDGTGAYYFPAFLVVNYLVVPTADGRPLIVIAPEPALDAAFEQPIGHPSLGACSASGGAPMAFIGGDLQGTTLTNGSGRYGFESTITAANLDAAARLFNCYGIPITGVIFTPPP